ncbi:hypothetical protein BGZ76_009113 [Entomortierella beljakovae]|nr:hypothetical protein BGZ76_009113 [Entomortierella beljakovae]
MIRGELYAILRSVLLNADYRIYRETKTITDSEKKSNIWIANGIKYGIECKVNKVTEAEIRPCIDQAIDYGRDRENIKALFLINFVPAESVGASLPFPNAKREPEFHWEIVHVLYYVENKYARIQRKNRPRN